MTQYTVWIVSPLGYLHSRCFEEVALSLNEAVLELGHESKIVTRREECTGKTIVLGAHLLSDGTLPSDSIIYNLEQAGGNFMTLGYLGLLSEHEVWDYSPRNIEILKKYGIEARLCEIGYMPGLTRIINNQDPSIDVLFIGSQNERRMNVLRRLAAMGVAVHCAFNVYGEERNALIADAKIVLNMHFYDAGVFEIVRCSQLMANKACIVSETGMDEKLEEPYKDAVCFCSYDSLITCCLDLLADDSAREALAQKGFEVFSGCSQAGGLRGLV